MGEAKIFSLGVKDLIKGLIITVIGAVVGIVAPILDAAVTCYTSSTGADCNAILVFNYTTMWHVAVAAGASYLIKNFLTTSDDKFLKKEVKPEVSKEDK